jgi:hypothetical protein
VLAGMRIVVAFAALALIAPAGAQAGTYDVVSCRAPGAGGVNHAWEAAYGAWGSPNPEVAGMFDLYMECPGPRTFLLARSKATHGVDAHWAHSAYLHFDAPPNTTISRLRIWRHGQTVRGDGGVEEWDILAQTDDGDLVFEKCIHAAGQDVCNTGAGEPLNGKTVSNASLATHDVDTRFVNLGVVCSPNGFKSCATANSTPHPYASFNLWGSVVTIRDDARPSLAVGGSLWSDGWHRPTEPLTYDASDNAGIRSVQASIGGAVASANGSCDYRREAPCPRQLRGTLTLGSAPPDGAHEARVAAVDAAGNESTATRGVLIDGTAPRVDLRRPRLGRIIVGVRDDASGFAAGQIYVRNGSAEPYRALATALVGKTMQAIVDRGKPTRTDVRVMVRDNAGNEVNGLPARLTLTSARSGKRKLKLRKGRVRARFGRRLTLRGKLTLSAGQPLVGVPISVSSTARGGGGATPEGSGTTGRRGRFAITVGEGASRNLLLSYAGVDDGLPAQRRLGLRVPASSSIRASRKRLSGAGRVRFGGRVRQGGAGLVVVLQGYEAGRWRTFADTRTRANGKWRASYRFSGRPGRYPIRLRIRRQTGLAYDTGYSRRIVVRVS